MSTDGSVPERTHPAAERASVVVASVAILIALAGVAYRPALLTPIAAVLALAAALMGGRRRGFAGAAVAVAGIAWLAGMTIAVLTENTLF